MIMVDMVTPFAVQVTVAVLQVIGIPPSAALGTNIKIKQEGNGVAKWTVRDIKIVNIFKQYNSQKTSLY